MTGSLHRTKYIDWYGRVKSCYFLTCMSDTRLRELDAEVAHLERTVAELPVVVWKQRQVGALRKLLGTVQDHLAAEPRLVEAGHQDKPPHH